MKKDQLVTIMGKSSNISHVAYSDESNWNKGRYRSLALITSDQRTNVSVDTHLRQILKESSVKEFMWKRFDNARDRFLASKMLRYAVELASKSLMRIDVLVWDIEDSRHKIHGRDDIENLQRMYYHLLKWVLCNCWPSNSTWSLNPDEHSALDWQELKSFLHAKSQRLEYLPGIGLGQNRFVMRRLFNILEIRPRSSQGSAIGQLADLFAGISVFSRSSYDRYREWQRTHGSQLSFPFDSLSSPAAFTNSEKERFPVLDEFYSQCKKLKLGISLENSRGLRTFKKSNPINFWHYVPQHVEDTAPLKTA